MPANSKVHKMFSAMVGDGMDKGKAARVAQSKSGQALATGKPSKKRRVPVARGRPAWQQV